MIRIAVFVIYACAFAVVAARAGELPKADPGEVGLTARKLVELKPALQKLVDEEKTVGGVALVARRGKVAFVDTFGYRDAAAQTPTTEDTIFAIASMTKPVTAVAAMMLVEEGKLGLDDPVSKYLPQLKELRVLGDAKDDTDAVTATVPSNRQITVRDLLTHTSGIAYGGLLAADTRLAKLYAKAGIQMSGFNSIADEVGRLATVPLLHQPGEGWTYGMSHDVLGGVIEVVSGRNLDTYMRERIFAPLDMYDTGFLVPEGKRDRVATIYRHTLFGKLVPLPKKFGSATYFSGGGGLFSTARDYARFAQMLLNGGRLDGARILKPETLALMTTNQIGAHRALTVFKYGLGFGLEMIQRPDSKPEISRYFWGGLYSTYFWVDPEHEVVAIVLTQILPTNSSGAERVFRRIVDAAIEK